jgi:hypothetical protein
MKKLVTEALALIVLAALAAGILSPRLSVAQELAGDGKVMAGAREASDKQSIEIFFTLKRNGQVVRTGTNTCSSDSYLSWQNVPAGDYSLMCENRRDARRK